MLQNIFDRFIHRYWSIELLGNSAICSIAWGTVKQAPLMHLYHGSLIQQQSG